MRKLILASVSAVALFGIAACSDSNTDSTTTQSVTPPATEQTTPTPPANEATLPPATDPAPSTPPAAPAQ